ncbi:MAG: phage tail protein [Nostoc sp.]|jgi:phage tail-like protein|uniref:phage tail protein n=1 Tax=unclassified Nostoc TaxID=2593658 RepID=UPI0025DB9B87|nr:MULTISPECIES: phage tail protein [unclassified Nostoc]MBN3941456.1 phage tail protein [Nostoc sp. NMS9]MDZ8231928.1 phage tail protein [Nostoc sp. ChiQUE02]
MSKPSEILTSCRFYVEIKLDGSTDQVDGYFLECKGFKHTQDVVEICEVTPGRWGQAKAGQLVRTKIPGNVKTNNINLRRGITESTTLWKWFEAVQEGNWAKQLRDGSLTIYDQAGNGQAIFQFRGAWPVSYIASDFSANGNEFAIEEMEIAVETFTRQQ